MLKNAKKTLPLDGTKQYLVVGEMFEKMRYQGAGSSLLRPYKLVTPKDAFDANGVRYEYCKGYNVNSFETDSELSAKACSRANDYDTILFFGGLSEYAESEGFDRKTLSLPKNQLDLIHSLYKSGKSIVFVMYGGSPVDTSFDYATDAILNMYLPGQSGGEATHDLLFGKACPSGRLAETWPMSYDDVPFGDEFTVTTNDRYKESIFVGYRYYTSFDMPVKYPFGYGLSYTDFAYTNMSAEQKGDLVHLEVDVENIGGFDGATVLEIFVNAPKSEVIKPLRELRGFEKVFLASGEKKRVGVDIPVADLRYYIDGAWRLEGGEYVFELCTDANTPVLDAALTIHSDDEVRESDFYIQLYGSDYARFLSITDSEFDNLIGMEIPEPKVTRPYDLNTPIRSYSTLGGRMLFALLNGGFELIYKLEKSGKETPDKETKVKNAYFSWKTIETMSLRSICYASEGRLSHHLATILLEVANNHPLRALGLLFKPEKNLKLPE